MSQAYDDQQCYGCSNPGDCFHNTQSGNWGYYEVNAPGGGKSRRNRALRKYVAQVWASCDDNVADSEWWIEVLSNPTNGVLTIMVDGGVLKANQKKGWIQLPISGNAKSRVRVVFTPNDPGKPSSAKVWMEAFKVAEKVDGCMSGAACLSKLGT